MTDDARTTRHLELISTVLLALATVATAWAAYQSGLSTKLQTPTARVVLLALG